MPRFDLVVFDCDSTLSAIEGVDELAARAGVGDESSRLTRLAMDGDVGLEEVYGRRLELIRPDRNALRWLGKRYLATLVPGARETVHELQAQGRQVHIVSGGLQQAVLMLATELGIPATYVHAVPAVFAPDGSYIGFDTNAPLARAGGKADVVADLVAGLAPGTQNAVMVGDGVTDLEAATAGAVVIGFGGVVQRQAVKERADHYLAGPSLLPVIQLIEQLEMI